MLSGGMGKHQDAHDAKLPLIRAVKVNGGHHLAAPGWHHDGDICCRLGMCRTNWDWTRRDDRGPLKRITPGTFKRKTEEAAGPP